MRKFFQLLLQAVKGEETDYTKGNINRAIILLSVPMVLEMVMESLFLVADVFFVSRLGHEAVSILGLTESILMLMESIAIGLGMAATAIVARRIGEKDEEGARVGAIQAVILGFTLSIIIAGLGVYFSKEILSLMSGDEALAEYGQGYFSIMFGFNITLMMIFVLNSIFRGAGDAAIAMKILWIANGINIILDPCFIFGLGPFPELGLEGAAVATNIGRGTAVLLQLFVLFNGRSLIKVTFKNFKLHLTTIKKLLRLAITASFQFLISTASWVFMVKIISGFGSEAMAGYTIAFRVIVFTVLPSWGLAMAAATLVGQNLGAGEFDRAEKSVWKCAFYNMCFLAIVSLVFFIFARQFIMIFDQDPEVVKNGILALRIICLSYIFFAYGMVISQAFNGAGDTTTPTIINFVAFWIVQIPIAYGLAVTLNFGPSGVYWAIVISNCLSAIIGVIVFKKGKWKQVIV